MKKCVSYKGKKREKLGIVDKKKINGHPVSVVGTCFTPVLRAHKIKSMRGTMKKRGEKVETIHRTNVRGAHRIGSNCVV